MVRERVPKKPVRVTLDFIKDKMKEKRNKKLARAAGYMKGSRSRLAQNPSVGVVPSDIQVTLQQNNVSLAIALQAEKVKLREANAAFLQLQGEYQSLFMYLLMLKRKLHQQQAISTCSPLAKESELSLEADFESPRKRITEGMTALSEISPICTASPKLAVEPDRSRFALPPTVMVRPKDEDKTRKTRRRSARVQELCSVSKATSGARVLRAQQLNQEQIETIETEEKDFIREEVAPVRKIRERGRKPERVPLKKPWETPKPRARSKSRAPATQQQSNTSLGFNDTFDFDCEEAVHLTPFKAKIDHPDAPTRDLKTPKTPAPEPPHQDSSLPTSPSSDSEDSLYMPWKKPNMGHTVPEILRTVTTRRRQFANQNGSPRKSVTRREGEKPIQEVDGDQCTFSTSPHQLTTHQQEEPLKQELMDEDIAPVGAFPEANLITYDDVLSNFGDSLCQAGPASLPSPIASQTQHRRMTTQKTRVLSRSGMTHQISGRTTCSLSDVSNQAPAASSDETQCSSTEAAAAPARRRRTQTVNYKEPSLSTKLRRGDKHTDLRFLRPGSPIFKETSSGRKSRASNRDQNKLDKYNESFVGCH
ncbi:shugoshin 1 isoform X2 [Stigmatopora argus]